MTAMTSADVRSRLAAANQALAEADAELEAARATAALADDKPAREALRKAQVRRADAQERALISAAVPAAEAAEAEQRRQLQIESVHRAARAGIVLDQTAVTLKAEAKQIVLGVVGALNDLDQRIRVHDDRVAAVRAAGGIPRPVGFPSQSRAWAALQAELARLAETYAGK